jgi:hypothetical protein
MSVDVNKEFAICGDCVSMINDVSGGTKDFDETEEELKVAVWLNMKHLKKSITESWYINDSETRNAPANKTSITAAITTSESYLPDGYSPEGFVE